jgi:hypothetical protein
MNDGFVGRLEPGLLLLIAAVKIGDYDIASLREEKPSLVWAAAADEHMSVSKTSADMAGCLFEHSQLGKDPTGQRHFAG